MCVVCVSCCHDTADGMCINILVVCSNVCISILCMCVVRVLLYYLCACYEYTALSVYVSYVCVTVPCICYVWIILCVRVVCIIILCACD